MAIFKKKKDYFYESFAELAKFSKEAIEELERGLNNFDSSNLVVLKNSVHEIEHRADLKKHEIEERLAKEFITPIDREDIFLLLDKIDDLTDSIDEISYKLYIRNYQKIPANASIFMNKTKEAIYSMLLVLDNMDKISNKKVMDPLLNKVIEIEEEVDQLYEVNVRDLYKEHDVSYMDIVMSEKVYSYFEYVTDKCRDIIKQIQIIMYKNL